MKTPTKFILTLTLLLPLTMRAQTLGTTSLLEAGTAGSDSVVLVAGGNWTASAIAPWLHLSAAGPGSAGGTNVVFTYDANPGATRTGTLNIAGQTLFVTQAGSTYVAITNLTDLVSSNLNQPGGIAVDGAGNVYIADTFDNAVKEWSVTSNTVTTLVFSGLNQPYGMAVDGAGNVYFSDLGHNAVKELSAASNTVSTLNTSGLVLPYGVALDSAGNLYIADH